MMDARKWLVNVPQCFAWTLCGLLTMSIVGANIAGKLKVALVRHGIIPEIMMQAPKLGIYVAYGKKYSAKFGNLVPIEVTGTRPSTLKWKTQDNEVYTLVAMDLDAIPKLDRKDETEFERLLWMVVNIPAAHNVNVSTGETLAKYIGPSLDPIKGEDHRILFLVFEQHSERLNFTVPILESEPSDPKRNDFNVHKFMEDYKLGLPVAANFYCTREGLLATTTLPPSNRKTKASKGPKTTTPESPVVTAERIEDIDYI